MHKNSTCIQQAHTRSAIKRAHRMKRAYNQINRLHNQNKRTHKQIRTSNNQIRRWHNRIKRARNGIKRAHNRIQITHKRIRRASRVKGTPNPWNGVLYITVLNHCFQFLFMRLLLLLVVIRILFTY